MGEISKDHKPNGLQIYYENNSVEFLSGQANGLRNKWRNSRQEGIVCIQVFEGGEYSIWQKGDDGKRKDNTYNYSRVLQGFDYYWYDDNDDTYHTGDTIPAGINAEDIGNGKLTTKDYFTAVYNFAIINKVKPNGNTRIEPISPTLPSQVSTSFDGVLV